ncbi:MAG: ATP-binding cassette domain-containing protein [Alistipes sp.]|nr:ATP-binding cassette domain-containing protein [Alistipes sp.]
MGSKPQSASRWLNKNIAEVKGDYIRGWIFTLFSAGCFVAFSRHISIFAAALLDTGSILTRPLLYSLAFLTGRYIFARIASGLNYKAGEAVVSGIKRKLYPSLLGNNRIDSISGTLTVTRIADDLKPYFAFFIPNAMASVLVAILVLAVCFRVEKWVGIILLASFLVIPFLMSIIGIGAESIHKKHIGLFMRYSAIFHNRLLAVAEIVNLDNFTTQYKFLSRKSRQLDKATVKVMRVAILSSAALELFVTLSIAMVAVYLGLSLLGIMVGPNYGKGYDFQTALFLLILSPYFFFYLRKFVSAYHDRNRALAAAQTIMPLLDQRTDSVCADAGQPLSTFEITGLDFAYPGSPVKVLSGIEVKLPVKGLVLVKGISGSGKSTLLKICAGSLAAEEGRVSVNGMDNQCSQQWLDINTAYMNQFPFIFDGTLRYNVLLDEDADGKVQYPGFMDGIVDKKQAGWQTLLSHNGRELSGGEKQLVTLARMLMHPRPVAILDEPTASLDRATAGIILREIVGLSRQRLVIVASHEEMFEGVADTIINLNWGEQEKP